MTFKGNMRKAAVILIVMLLIIAASVLPQLIDRVSADHTAGSTSAAKTKPVSLTLFSDITDWDVPEWSADAGTVTGSISAHTGISLNFVVPAQDADKKLSLLLDSNKLPDIITISDPNMIRQLITSGKVWNLHEFFSEYKPDAQILSKISRQSQSDLTYRDGGWYSLTSGYTTEDLSENYNTIIWNRKLLRRLGLKTDDLRTESDVYAALQQAEAYKRSEDGSMIPVLYDGSSYQSGALMFLAYSFGGSFTDSENNYHNIWETDGGREALLFTSRLLRNGILKPDYLAYDISEIKNILSDEDSQVLCYIGNISDIGIDPDEWVSTGAVRADSGASPVMEVQNSTSRFWANTFVSTSCTDLPGAADLLDYIYSGSFLQDSSVDEGLQYFDVFHNPLWQDVYDESDASGYYEGINALKSVYSTEKDLTTYDSRLVTFKLSFYQKHNDAENIDNRIQEVEADSLAGILSADDDQEFEDSYNAMISEIHTEGGDLLDDVLSAQIRKNADRLDRHSKRGDSR